MDEIAYHQMFKVEGWFWWYKGRRDIIKSVLNQIDGECHEILEIGSGTGGNVSLLKNYGSYCGIEKDSLAISYFKKNHPDTEIFQLSLPEEVNEITRKFDLILILDVLEHIEGDELLLHRIKECLSDRGKIIVTTPAHQFLWSGHDIVHHHYRRYSKKQLCKVVSDAGMVIEYHSYFNCFLFPVAIIAKFFGRFNKQGHKTEIPNLLNRILYRVFKAESKFIPKWKLPFGVSHLMILKK